MPVLREIHHFGNVVVDLSNLQLTVDGSPRPLEPKAFRLLQFLIENPGRAVSKDEILAAVWPDTAVTDNALTRSIAQLRKALGDDSKEPRFIETIPTVGYRFLAVPDPVAIPSPIPPTPAPRRRYLLAIPVIVILALAAYAYSLRSSPAAPPVFQTNSQATAGDGLDINASFSPDGRLFAYASDRTGSFEIYVRPADGDGRDTQVTSNGGQNLFPSFSPDGQSLAFSSFRNPGIYRTATHGGTVERLTSFGAQPVWSPDGKWIAFVSHHRPSLGTTDFYFPAPDTTLWLLPAAGGTPRELTPRATFTGGQAFPSWSTDGKELRFVNYVSRAASLWTYQLGTGQLQKRFELPNPMTLGSAVFSRDDRNLYYVSAQLNGDISVWHLPLHPTTLEPVGDPQLIYHPSLGSPRDLALSPDGRRLSYSAVLNSSQIRIQKWKSGHADGAPVDIVHDTGYRFNMPVWSPDGSAILYTKLPLGRPAQSWLDPLNGTPAAPLGRIAVAQHYPTFLDGGKTVRALVITGGGKVHEIHDISLSDGAITVHPLESRMAQPCFATDGRYVFYHSTDPIHQVWKWDRTTNRRTQMTNGPEPYGYASLSPDGQRLQIQRLLRGATEVWIMPAAGGKPELAFADKGVWYTGGWSSDSKEMIIAGNTGNGWALYAAGLLSHSIRRLTADLPLRAYARYPRWSPAGDRIAYEYSESKGNVFIAGLKP